MFLPLKERYALWADALERTQSASTAATAADAIKSGAPEQEGGGVEEAEAGEEKGGMHEILARKMAKGGDQVTAIKSLRANDEDDDVRTGVVFPFSFLFGGGVLSFLLALLS